jgi:type III restriction enzyme
MEEVIAYARNDHLGFAIPYLWQNRQHEYRPDYLVRL